MNKRKVLESARKFVQKGSVEKALKEPPRVPTGVETDVRNEMRGCKIREAREHPRRTRSCSCVSLGAQNIGSGGCCDMRAKGAGAWWASGRTTDLG